MVATLTGFTALDEAGLAALLESWAWPWTWTT